MEHFRICSLAVTCLLLLGMAELVHAQEPDSIRTRNEKLDSLYIEEVENVAGERPKVLHAEPLYVDLIRDLGARKGEKEWNLGFGITDNLDYDVYEALLEYEWAPIDRLGLEVETPFTFHGSARNGDASKRPSDRLNSLKLAAQWTFLVNERRSTSLALGYIHEFELSPFDRFGDPLLKGHIYDPFFIAAKRWGSNWHTLLYAGPTFEQHLAGRTWETRWEANVNLHYMISGTRNFIGLESNMTGMPGDVDLTLRPQMRVGIADNFLVGIVAGIPVERENQRFSMFTRLIWEPGHRH